MLGKESTNYSENSFSDFFKKKKKCIVSRNGGWSGRVGVKICSVYFKLHAYDLILSFVLFS